MLKFLLLMLSSKQERFLVVSSIPSEVSSIPSEVSLTHGTTCSKQPSSSVTHRPERGLNVLQSLLLLRSQVSHLRAKCQIVRCLRLRSQVTVWL